MKPTASLYADLEFRGLVKQVTAPELAYHLGQKCLTLYAGFDPTADSLHVGSLLPLLTLRRFQLAGHQIIGVVGGATGMIGDPSGKSQERSLQNAEQLSKNQVGITRVIEKFLELRGDNPARITNNHDWFKDFSYLEFLRDVGKHFTVNHMMAKESVRARLEDRDHGISYTEFSYMLLQAYDFYHLYKTYGCTLQIGGSDQWGNITAGTELIRRMNAHDLGNTPNTESPEVFGLTHPLVSKADGTKFGKSETGTVWLSRDRTSPYQFYQFFIQTADADVGAFLRYFTFLSHEEILDLEATLTTAPEKRAAQIRLAREVTKLVHGEAELDKAERATQALFSTEIRNLDVTTLKEVFAGAPQTTKAKTTITGAPLALLDLLVDSGLCASRGAAKKEILGGGIYLNNERMTDAARVIEITDLIADSGLVLRKGKKNYHLISFT
ncbi:MAG: tyrosine--tRNA ligase [Methylotenera sp.]|nr:tyrosine--tRNA ligase [Oligoflexia bacterium]